MVLVVVWCGVGGSVVGVLVVEWCGVGGSVVGVLVWCGGEGSGGGCVSGSVVWW